jgi:hypothetical protein
VSEFKRATRGREVDATTATAHLPGLDIEIVHRLPDGDAERILINLQATPSFEAFGRYLEAVNPFVFWARPPAWLGSRGSVARALMPANLAPPLPSAGSDVAPRAAADAPPSA